jgi:glycosyltransferase involved in cell wall biosynthesis
MAEDRLTALHLNTERGWRGGEQQMLYLAQGLRARGHAAHVACRPGGECLARVRAAGLPAHELSIRGDLDIFAARKLGRLIDEIGADVVHAHTSRTHVAAMLAKRFSARKPRCIVHRRVDFSIHKLPLRLSGLKYRWGVDRYIAITEAVKGVMIADGIPAERISVVHSSVDLGRFEGVARKPGLRAELGVPEGARVVGNVGALVGHKGQRFLLEAAALALKEAPETWFVILGEGPLRGALEAQARALGIAERVRLPGFRRDVPECLLEFDLFCMSSVMEGLGTSALEAMAMRRPVVATDAGGLAEVVRDGVNGLTAPAGDGPALGAALLRLLRDGALAARLAEEGRRTVEVEFTADRMVERTVAVYRQVIGGG